MGNINVDKSVIDAVQREIASGNESMKGSIDSLIREMEAGKAAWNSSENIDFDGVISTLKSIQSDYSGTNEQFMQTLSDSVATYQEQDMNVQSQMAAAEGGTSPVITAGGSGSGVGPSGGPANVSTDGKSPVIDASNSSKTSTKNREKGEADYDATSPESYANKGYAVPGGSSSTANATNQRPSYVPEGATQRDDGRWQTVDANGNVTIYNNPENGIQGAVIDINDPNIDPRVKALANGMEGGQIVKLDDGRLAVKDKYGGGTIFNKDGSTMDVSSKTIHAGEVGKVSASSNGGDPYSQELANQLINDGYSDKKIEKMVNKWEEKGELSNADGVMSAVEARREQEAIAKESGIPLVSPSPNSTPVAAQPSPTPVATQPFPNVGGTQASPSKSPVIEAGASRRSSSGGDLPSLDWETDPNPFVQHRANGDKYQ